MRNQLKLITCGMTYIKSKGRIKNNLLLISKKTIQMITSNSPNVNYDIRKFSSIFVLFRILCFAKYSRKISSLNNWLTNILSWNLKLTRLNIKQGKHRTIINYHMSMDVVYSVDPSNTSGGRYLRNNNIFYLYAKK